ncbi:pyruvate dehydrogenase (acetyl-transferring) E1 component subunit alpha [Marinobacterium sp. D7]|uniref:pyruvate dehydrogenase (acetyl-transferring) E1 component subunit alpha n=1 Tax=Marinobacterium ramblicola TaxID=2849041 RepID=UPI001C2CFA99|nr:pyruvate dehydrogenase (acetyl-transferring) E1 component subunit alpha [Marinobacterium ramblicola]MBV1786640.1 pyruvate dehydrogenase (acetyl-transferring) E1 component subunit alpha [Marinobacterium ramblicola]
MITAAEPLPDTVDGEHALVLFTQMLRVRRFEEKSAEMYSKGNIRGFLHLYIGEEAVGTGIMQSVAPQDAVVATYREHGHALLRGIPMNAVMAEMFGKQEGCSRGRGGSMHLFDKATRFIGGNAIVGGGLPVAVGYALAAKMRGTDAVAWCIFGEGAMAEGEFHESLNLAELWQLPVVFCCENNFYAMGTALDRSESETRLVEKARSYRLDAEVVDGMDVLATEAAARRAADSARSGNGPYFIEFQTYRFKAHSMFDAERYRSKEEVHEHELHGPLRTFAARLSASGLLDDDKRATLEAEIAAEIEAAVAFAEAGTPEPVDDLTRFVYSEVQP